MGSECCQGGGWWKGRSLGFGLSRRFNEDYERLPETAKTMIYGAMSRISCCTDWRGGRHEGSFHVAALDLLFAKLPLEVVFSETLILPLGKTLRLSHEK